MQTPGTVLDTFRIGALNPGNYTIHYRAFVSFNQQVCDSSFSQVKTQTFRINSPLRIQQAEKIAQAEIYPNPVKDVLWVKGNRIGRVVIFNLPGQELKRLNFNGENKVTLNLEFLPNGVYLIEIAGENGKYLRRKIVKE